MHTENFYVGLEAGMTKNASITKEAFWGRLFGTTAEHGAQGVKGVGQKLWGQTAGAAVPTAQQAGVGAFGSMASQGWRGGTQAFRDARLGGQGMWDSLRTGFGQGADAFNSMYKALSPEAQKRMANYGKGVAGTTLVGGGALGSGALV